MSGLPDPFWQFSFSGSIWRIVADAEGKLLAIQVQQHAEPTTAFAIIDIPQKALICQNFPIKHYSTLAVSAIYQATLYLQALAAGQPPQPEAIIAVDIASQQIRWQRSRCSWFGITTDGPVVSEVGYEKIRYYLLNAQDGSIKAERNFSEFQLIEEKTDSVVQYAVHYPLESEYSTFIAQFIQAKLGVSPVPVFDYAQKGNAIVISYYLYQTNHYNNFLAVFDRSGHLRWQEKIAETQSGAGFNTFLIVNDLLIFVKEKNQLLGYVL